ncbi:MAG TPA: SCO family protein [Verrucomicrobiae bacterium]|nr:SCO family protein [Verrucomicrobiae bacterium]
MRTMVILLCLLGLISVNGCSRRTDASVYVVEGTVERTYPGEARIQIAHDQIPGYMQAMTMDFNAKSAGTLFGLQPGDRVRFNLVVTREKGWIENVQCIGKAASKLPRTLAAPALWTAPLKVGQVIPDVTFTNQLGQQVKLSDYRGQALAISFIFTRCPFPDYCPRMSKQMAKVHESLSFIPNAPTNWHLFSVSFDPEYDRPGVLQEYRRNLHVEDRRWDFLSGAPSEIKSFCAQFGVYFMRDRGTIEHNLMTAVIDTQGRLQRLFPGNKWRPDDVIDELASAAALPIPNNLVVR